MPKKISINEDYFPHHKPSLWFRIKNIYYIYKNRNGNTKKTSNL